MPRRNGIVVKNTEGILYQRLENLNIYFIYFCTYVYKFFTIKFKIGIKKYITHM